MRGIAMVFCSGIHYIYRVEMNPNMLYTSHCIMWHLCADFIDKFIACSIFDSIPFSIARGCTNCRISADMYPRRGSYAIRRTLRSGTRVDTPARRSKVAAASATVASTLHLSAVCCPTQCRSMRGFLFENNHILCDNLCSIALWLCEFPGWWWIMYSFVCMNYTSKLRYYHFIGKYQH